jgi:hypothetical protein
MNLKTANKALGLDSGLRQNDGESCKRCFNQGRHSGEGQNLGKADDERGNLVAAILAIVMINLKVVNNAPGLDSGLRQNDDEDCKRQSNDQLNKPPRALRSHRAARGSNQFGGLPANPPSNFHSQPFFAFTL